MSWERWQIVTEVLLLALLAVVTLQFFQPTDAMAITASLAVAYAVPRVIYTRRPWCTHSGRLIFGLVGILMVSLAVLTIWEDTVSLGLPLSEPHLVSDDRGYYRWALHYYDNSCPAPRIAFFGFSLLILATWKVLGVSVVWPLAMNVMFTLMTIVIAAAITRRLLRNRVTADDKWLATMGLALTAVLMYFLSQGLRIQKEASIYLAMALLGYVLAGMNNKSSQSRRVTVHDIVLWTIGCIILSLGRTTYLYFAAIGLALMAVWYWRANKLSVLWFGLIVVAAFIVGNLLARYSVEEHFEIVSGGYYMQKLYMGNPVQQPYYDIVGNYFYYSVWHRLAILPLACCVQFIIPFPWLYDGFSILNMFPRLAWGWYVVGGIALFYFAFMSWRKGMNIGAWAWWPAAIYVIIAYVVAGTVSRYLLPVEPLAVPMAVYVIARLREGVMLKTFKWWAAIYVVVLIVTLIVCYHIQLTYLHNLNDYYQSIM